LISAAAGAVPAIPGAVASAASTLIPGNLFEGALQAVAGPVGRGLGAIGAKLLPPIAARAPNAVRAVKAALSANIIPTIVQSTQSPGLAATEDVVARMTLFGGRVRAMRKAQESAFQELRTSTVKAAGPKVAVDDLGRETTEAIFGEVEALAGVREKQLAVIHRKVLKSGGDPTTAEAATRALDEIRIAKTEESRKTAGKLYEEVAALIEPDADNVLHSNMLKVATDRLERSARLPSAVMDTKARKLLEDIKKGPGHNVIENASDPMMNVDTVGLQFGESGVGGIDTVGMQLQSELVNSIKQRKAYTFQEMQTLRSTVNGLLHQAQVSGDDVSKSIYIDLKLGIDEDIKIFGAGLGGDLSKKFEFATSYYRETFKGIFKSDAAQNLQNVAKKNPQAAFDMLVGRGNVVDIKMLKKVVGEPGFAPMRSLAVERLVTSKEGRILGGAEIAKNLADYGDEALKEILTPKQFKDIVKYQATREMPQFAESALEGQLRKVIFKNGKDGVFRFPDEVVSRIADGDTTTLRAVKRIVGEKGTDPFRRRIIEDIIGEANDPTLLPGQQPTKSALKISKTLREYNPSFLAEVFDEKAMAQIQKIDDIKALLESQPRLNAAPGTAASAISMLTPVAAIGYAFTNPVTGIAAILSFQVISRLYTSEAGRMLLIEGLDPRLIQKLPTYTRILAAAANAARENAKDDGVNKK